MSASFSAAKNSTAPCEVYSLKRQLPLIPRAVPAYNLQALNVTHSPEDHIILNNSKRHNNIDANTKFQHLHSSDDSISYTSSSNFDDSSFFSHKSQFEDEPDLKEGIFTNERQPYQNVNYLLNDVVKGTNHLHGKNGCLVCENEKLQEALSQPPNSYGIKYLDPKIKKHIMEPKQKYEDAPNLVDILDNKSKGKKSEQNGAISGGIFQDNQSFFSQYDEKAYENLDSDCFFVDGRRKIDFIIALEEKKELPTGPGEDPKPPLSAKARAHEQKLADGRERYLAELEDQGVEIEEAQYDQWDTMITFYKLHITFPLLCDFAEEMNLRMPIKDDLLTEFDNELDNNETPPEFTEYLINRYLSFLPNVFAQKVPNPPKKFITVPFRKDFLHCFRNSENQEIFFKIRHRISIAMEILRSTSYGDPDRAETGIERLLSEEYFTAAYPLHDTLHKVSKLEEGEEDIIEEDEDEGHSSLSTRQVLWSYWAYWRNWYKYQPLHHVREYFGEKYAIYFYYLGFYTAWMCPIALIGFIIQICSLFYAVNNPVSKDICNSNYTMCPMCDDCEEWFSEKKCLFSAIGAAFDNGYTIFYAAFISMWSVVFLEFWKRSIAEMGAYWEVYDFAPLEERPRPAYIKQCTKIKKNPVTGKPEPYFPSEMKKTRRMIGGVILIFIICLIFAVLLVVVIVRSLSTAWVFSWGVQIINDFNVPPIIANGIGTIVQVIGLLIITTVWKNLAVLLTEWEANRTEGEYENSVSIKLSVVAFLELYLPILYIAFFKGKGLGGPGFYTRIVGARLENCPNSDCLWEMAMQLIVFFAVKQWIQNAVELGVPLIMSQVNKFLKKRQKKEYKKKMGKQQEKQEFAEVKANGYDKRDTEINVDPIAKREEDEEDSEEERIAKRTRWEHDYFLNPNAGLFEDYMELMVQFGFVTMFACAFPIGPILALANNIIEIRSDAWKYTALTRRPVPERSKDIGIWFDVLFFLSRLAVFTNAYLMCFTSYYLDRQVYSYVFPEDSGLNNFYNFTLVDAPPVYLNGTDSDGQPKLPCKYEGYYDSNGDRTEYFWRLLAIKLAYMIAFEHIIFLIGITLEIIIPDTPEDVELRIKREAFIATEIFSPVRNHRDDRTKDGAEVAYPDDPFHID